MTLEELIYKRLTTSSSLTEKLALYGDVPAIFYQTAPGDQDDGWKNKRQYPRIDFIVDMQANPERQSSGMMTLNIWCDEVGEPPEVIEPEVRNILCDIFMQPKGQPPFCLVWVRSDNFDANINTLKASHIMGATVIFDVLAFPNQETIDPDPVMALNHFIKEWNPDATVIGTEELPDFFIPEGDKPAFYFRLASLDVARETNSVVWMNASIACHIFAPTAEKRFRWLKYFVDTLANMGEITMLDTSPMFLKSIKADSTVDYLTTGQIRLNVQFGILRKAEYTHLLNTGQMQQI